MNRVIVIGNGFDKAHGLKTGYRDFIDGYWEQVTSSIYNGYKLYLLQQWGVWNDPAPYEDEFVKSYVTYSRTSEKGCQEQIERPYGNDPYSDLCDFVIKFNSNNLTGNTLHVTFKNEFFKRISERCSLMNWLDIENEYYAQLKELLTEHDATLRHEKVRKLNLDFDAVRKRLVSYLSEIVPEIELKPFPSIQDVFSSQIRPIEVACGKQRLFIDSIIGGIIQLGKGDDGIVKTDVVSEDKKEDPDYLFCRSKEEENRHYVLKRLKDDYLRRDHCTPVHTLILNFNYTRMAEKLYAREKDEVINIHGELDNPRNPIIFGYGDELDEDYKRIEKLQDNDFLENIKSVRYHETSNYKKLLDFLESAPYQVITMGHSCGNSDRTLLNTLFEHPNCISVKVYYHQREDGTDDYSNLIRNLSRNFNDKAAMRDTVVNKEMCSPLVPL